MSAPETANAYYPPTKGLVNSTVLLETYIPGPPLSLFVEEFWYYEGLDVPYKRERVLPDGTATLMVNLSQEPRFLFDRDSPNQHTDFRRAWVSGTQAEYLVIDARRGASMIGVHFKPGGLAPFVPVPAHELHDGVVELDAVRKPQHRGLGRRGLRL